MSTTSLSNACATALSIFVGAKGSCGSQSATPVLNACAQDDSLLWSSNFASAMMDQVAACQSSAAYIPPLLDQYSLIALIVAAVIVALNLVNSVKKVMSSNAEEAQYRLKGYNPSDDVESISRSSHESSNEIHARDIESGEAADHTGQVITIKTGAHTDTTASFREREVRSEVAEAANEMAKNRAEATRALKAAQNAQKLVQREAMEAQRMAMQAQKSAAAAAVAASKSI